jgi:hypothetical protein
VVTYASEGKRDEADHLYREVIGASIQGWTQGANASQMTARTESTSHHAWSSSNKLQ